MAVSRYRVTCECTSCQRVIERARDDGIRRPFCGHVAPFIASYRGLGPVIVVGVESVNGTVAVNPIGGRMKESCGWDAACRECLEETGWIIPDDITIHCVAMSGVTGVFVVDFGTRSKDRVMNPRTVPEPELLSVEYLRLSDLRVLRRYGNEVHVVTMPVSSFAAKVAADICQQMGIARGDISDITIVE